MEKALSTLYRNLDKVKGFEQESKAISALEDVYINIRRCHQYGGDSIDFGSFGRDLQFDLSKNDEDIVIQVLREGGFRVDLRENMHKLRLAIVVKWKRRALRLFRISLFGIHIIIHKP